MNLVTIDHQTFVLVCTDSILEEFYSITILSVLFIGMLYCTKYKELFVLQKKQHTFQMAIRDYKINLLSTFMLKLAHYPQCFRRNITQFGDW